MLQSTKTISAVLFSITVPLIGPIKAQGAPSAQTVDVAAIRNDKKMPAEIKSQLLADASERLLMARAIEPAAVTAHEALQADRENPKARLLSAIIAPGMEMKGIAARIEPLVKTRPDVYSKYQQAMGRVQKQSMNGSLTDFVAAGPRDIHTESELQEVIARYINKLDELRRTLKDLKSGPEISLNLPAGQLKALSWRAANEPCAKTIAPEVYDVSQCELPATAEHLVNRADLEVAQQTVAGEQVYLTFLNAWDASGVFQAATRMNGQSAHDMNVLLADKRFGTLRKDQAIGVIPDIMKDAVVGFQYASQAQAELCPKGKFNPKNRPGYVFADGLCVKTKSKLGRQLATLEMVLKGPTTIVANDGTAVTVNAKAFFESPVADIRNVMPVKTTKNGCFAGFKDPTFGGLFPNGDLDRLSGGAACKN